MSNGKALEAGTIGHEDDPYTYNKAMKDVEANLQKGAMNVEMESMGSKPTSSKQRVQRRKFASCLNPFMV